MKKPFIKIIALGLGLISIQVLAVNLLDVYQQAQDNDPTYKVARAQWLSDRENIVISRAALLPAITASAEYGKDFAYSKNRRGVYEVNLTQPIFNYAAWAALSTAKSAVKASAAQFSAAAQDLMLRTAQAYFGVLEAQDILRYTLAEKRSVAKQLEQTRQRYKVGLVAITGVYQAQAQYDTTVANEIKARNDLANAKEKLREITGAQYESFAELGSSLPLVTPSPDNIDQWVETAEQQNYSLQAARFNEESSRENINAKRAGHLPVLNLAGKAQYTSINDKFTGDGTSEYAGGGVQLAVPVVQGGAVVAQSNQASYDYQKAVATTELTRRTVISNTRQDYLGVLSGISVIKADKQAIVSNRSSLKATEAGYIVGTQTMVDVLKVQSDLYNAQKNLATDQYGYILQTLALKNDAGTLSGSDLQQINSWLRANQASQAAAATEPKSKAKPKPVATRIKPTSEKTIIMPLKKSRISSLTSMEEEILKSNPRHYAVQIIARQNKESVIRFVGQHRIGPSTHIIRTRSKGRNWYIAVYNNFRTYAAAKEALNKLPSGVQAQKPWIRTIGSIQKAMIK